MRFGGIIHDTEEMATPFSIGEAIAYITVQPLDSTAFSSCIAANRRAPAPEPVGIIPNPNRRNNPSDGSGTSRTAGPVSQQSPASPSGPSDEDYPRSGSKWHHPVIPLSGARGRLAGTGSRDASRIGAVVCRRGPSSGAVRRRTFGGSRLFMRPSMSSSRRRRL